MGGKRFQGNNAVSKQCLFCGCGARAIEQPVLNILAVCVAAIAGWWGIIINAVPVCSEEFAVTGSELGKEDRVLARQKGSSVSAE